MRSTSRSFGAAMAGLILIGATCALAQDWPQWRGVNRDGKVTGFTAPADWPKGLTQKWKITVGTGNSTPALVGDKLYVFVRQGADEVALCLNAADGKEVWSNKYAAQAISGPAARAHSGPRSSPTVADGKVVTLGVGGVLSCLDAATGKEVWRNEEFKGAPRFFTGMSPIVVDGMCIAHLGGSGNGAVVAFDLATGAQKWKWAGDGPSYSSPVLMTVDGVKQLVVQTEKNLAGLAVADGKLLWQVACPTQGRAYSAATPIVDGQTVIYTGQGTGTKAVKIEKQGEAFAAKPLWSNDQLGTIFNTPELKDGLLFGLSGGGNLYCMKAQDGATAWTDSAKRQNFGAILDCGSVMLGLANNGELLVFKPSDKGYEELVRYKVADKQTYAHPVIAGNRIFVKDQDTLTLWTIEALPVVETKKRSG